jgi:transcriptional regulator PpsR
MTGTTGTAEITLRIDADGVIEEVSFGAELADESARSWIGRPWVDTVTEVTRPKVRRLIDEAHAAGVSGFRQVNHYLPSGSEIPVEYTAVQIDERGSLVAVGRSMKVVSELQQRLVRAQQRLERDHWRLREIETRYRLLFHRSPEAILVLETDGFRVVDANPAAESLLGVASGTTRQAALHLGAVVDEPSRGALESHLRRAHDSGRSVPLKIRLRDQEEPFELRAALMSGESDSFMLVHVRPLSDLPAIDDTGVDFGELFERIPDAMAIVDDSGAITDANRRFLALVQMPALAEVRGASLSRWLGRPGADWAILQGLVRRHGSVNLFSTQVLGELGSATEVEIAAVPTHDGPRAGMALLLRDIGRRLGDSGQPSSDLGAALAGLSRELGRSSLKSLVSRTVALVERRLLSDALELTEGNRTAAAQLLGLSRQGLYTKMARHDLDAPDGG